MGVMRPPALLLTVQRRLFALVGALLLAAAALQAVEPFAAPLERGPGSAFSAATGDVALAQGRRAELARVALAPLPLAALPTPIPVPSRRAALVPTPPLLPRATGPPPYPWHSPQTAPRAPPHA